MVLCSGKARPAVPSCGTDPAPYPIRSSRSCGRSRKRICTTAIPPSSPDFTAGRSAEREPILEAISADGELLDAGCANGYLLECLVAWGRERGISLIPYGLDQGARLIELARRRQTHLADHFFIGNAWDWEPPQRFRYVYTLVDQVPLEYLEPYLRRLLARLVAPGGRLIVGDYGSRSRGISARDAAALLRSIGLTVAGSAEGGSHGVARFAWSERDD